MAQIKKKFLASNAVDGAKVQFSNNESFRAKSSSGVDVELFKLDNSNIFQFLQMPRHGSDPVAGNDLSRKSYVDAQVLAEAAARVQADAAEQAAREAAVAAEQSRAEAAEEALQSALDSEIERATTAESELQTAIDAEQSRAEGVEAGLQAAVDALNASSATALQDEIAARQAADTTLQSNIDTEKARIDAILLASDADKDSFAEIVNLINSVDTENDSAFASYVLSNDAALAQEVSDRQTAIDELAANLDSEIARAGEVEGLLSAAIDSEAQARQEADTDLNGRVDQEASDREAAVSAEQSARESADADLQAAIDQEVSDRQAAVSGEEAARMAADSGIQSELDATQSGAGLGVDGSYSAPVGSQYLGSSVSLKDADSKLDAAIVAEVNARETAVSNLEQSISDLDAAMTQGFDDAQAYTDSQVAALVNGAPAILDTLKELADAIGDDANFATNIMTSIGNEASARQAADTAEANARSSADNTLQDNIDAEESARIAADSAEQSAREAADALESSTRAAELPRHAKVRKTLSSTDISNGYVDLDHVVLGSSTHVFIDRLACHETDDYSLSTVSGKTRVTFSESFMSSEEGPEAGDLFRCGYMYKNGDQPA